MNRVLEAEREAAVAITAAEADAEATLAAARETRRRLLERARDRASRVHVRAQARLAAAIAELDSRARGERGADAASDAIATRAIDNLARRLTSTDHEPA